MQPKPIGIIPPEQRIYFPELLRRQFTTHQEYLDFWYACSIDKIGMHSMLIEPDMAGNL